MSPKILRKTNFGNPILREVSRTLTSDEIISADIQTLIGDMRHTTAKKQYGVGLAAPQVGVAVALSVIAIKPTPSRPDSMEFDQVIINPEVIEGIGSRIGMWEGCISFGSGEDTPYAKALRYKKVRVRYLDERAVLHEEVLEGLPAHVFQHEVDHLNGILFVDRVRDSKTYITIGEYKKRYAKKPKK
jgi:peptide deformylase